MNAKKVVSLLLAGQMLSAPMAQAASLSRLDAARWKETGEARPVAANATRSQWKLAATSMPHLSLVAMAEATPSAQPSPAASPEATPTASAQPETTPTATPEPAPVPSPTEPVAPPTATPELPTTVPTPSPDVTATPTVEPTPTPEPEETPVTTAAPEPTTVPTPSPDVTPTPTVEPTPTPEPEETSVPTAEPTPSAAPTPEVTPPPTPEVTEPPRKMAMLSAVPYAASGTAAFDYAYVGYGYEEYHAAAPDPGGKVKQVKPYTIPNRNGITGGQKNQLARLAVEKPAGEDSGSFEGEIYRKDALTDWSIPKGWFTRADGTYALEDLAIGIFDDYGIDLIAVYSLRELEDKLGRIPDYQFDDWYVSSWDPAITAAWNSGTLGERYYLWNYDKEIATENIWTIGSVGRYITRVPLARGSGTDTEGQTYRDYLLSGSVVDMDAIMDTVVNTDEKRINRRLDFYYGDGTYNSQNTLGGNKDLPLMAHWKLSSDATLIDTAEVNADTGANEEYETKTNALYLVREGETEGAERENLLSDIQLYDKPLDDEDSQPVSFDRTQSGTYYIRLNSNVVGISPTLLATEAFKTEERSKDGKKTPGLTISVRQAGESESKDYACDKTILNDSKLLENGSVKLYNNRQYPMRSMWTLKQEEGTDEKYIPLTSVKSSQSKEDLYNEIKITLVAPDGKAKSVYTFFVQRLNDPWAVQNPGNTPYGMIERNTAESWLAFHKGMTVEEIVAEARDRFKNGYGAGVPLSFNGQLGLEGRNTYYPVDPVENNSGQYELGMVYHAGAWGGGDNLDLSETAIVVYQDSSFLDPGITVYDSQGDPVELDPASGNIRRSVKLRVSDSSRGLGTWDLTDASGVESYYSAETEELVPTAGATTTFQVLRDPDGKDRIDLRGAKVIPGVYSMEYQFTDPLSNLVYGSDTEENFVDKDKKNWETFTRPLVILPLPGDVDMDGAITDMDAIALEQALSGSSSLLSGSGATLDLFRYRVCDVNDDGEVNAADVVEIREGHELFFSRNNAANGYYYIPLRTGLEESEEQSWRARQVWDKTGTPAAGKAAISLEYLGKNTDAITDDPAELDNITKVDGEGHVLPLKRDDIFWVGVKLSGLGSLSTDAALRSGGIDGLSLTITYDKRYLAPATLSEGQTWTELIQRYNFAADSSATKDKYLWPAGLYALVDDGCNSDSTVVSLHSSDAIMPREGLEERWEVGHAKVTLHSLSNATSYRMLYSQDSQDEVYLLRIPFEAKKIPFNQTTLEGLDLQLSMQGLNLSYVQSGSTKANAAWNHTAQGVFGGATKNLADELTYVDNGATARTLPLAEDPDAVKVPLVNSLREDGKVIYGEPYEYLNTSLLMNQPADRISLPAGLTAELLSGDNLSGKISGIPTETGTFAFETTGGQSTICYIEVEKAPLHVAAKGQKLYYGEFDGTLDYVYDPADIKAADLPGGANYAEGYSNDGTSGQLKKLSGDTYASPVVTTDATRSSDAGEYTIEISPAPGLCELPNYQYVYTDGSLSGGNTVFTETTGETASSPLMIDKRPLAIEEITAAGMADVVLRVNTVQVKFDETAVTENSEDPDYKPGYTPVDLSAESGYEDKLSGTPIYGDDVVAVDFTATLTWDDENGPPYYILTHDEEIRRADISKLKLSEDTARYPANRNYELVGSRPRTTTAYATVKGNPVASVTVENAPKMEYTYGERISFALMKILVTYEDGTTAETTYGGENWLDSLGLSITWVEEKNGIPGPADQELRHHQELSAAVHHRKYLCVSTVKGYNGTEPTYACWYSDTPFHVSKKPIELTVKPLTVYYGEFQDTMLDYTYNVTQLTEEDRNTLLSRTGKTVLSGTSDELALLDGYEPPVLSAWKGDRANQERVTIDTPVWWQEGVRDPISYQIYMEGNSDPDHESGALNYSFQYMRGTVPHSDYGLGDLIILPRPIVVDSLTLGKYSDVFLYDDTSVTTLREMWYTGEDGYISTLVTVTGQNGNSTGEDPDAVALANADTFVASIPTGDDYIISGNTDRTPRPYPLTGDAIHVKEDGTKDKVVVTYVADYGGAKDNPSARPPDSAYFNMVVDGETRTEKIVPVTISYLGLANGTDNDNGNYILVYNTFGAANGARPVNNSAEALVRLRPLKSVQVADVPDRLDYTYGEQLALSGMSVDMIYENEGDNAPGANRDVITRRVNYRDTAGGSDTFADQGLKTYWAMDETLTIPDDVTPELVEEYLTSGRLVPTTDNGKYPDVIKNGKRLVLLGRRFDGTGAEQAGHVLVWTKTGEDAPFHVSPKTLPLTVEGKARFYGEGNGQYRASFALSDLAQPDQEAVAGQDTDGRFYLTAERDGAGSSDIRDVSTTATSPVLDSLNSKYLDTGAGETTDLGIRFTTRGRQGSDVDQYPIDIEAIPGSTGNMKNYVFDRNTSGTLRIFRRPITITKINQDPVSTIYYNTEETVFAAAVTQNGQGSDGFASVAPTFGDIGTDRQHLDPELLEAINAGIVTWPLSLTGTGVYGDDTVDLAMNVVFPAPAARNSFDTPGNQGEYQIGQPVTIRDLALSGDGEKNYFLYWSDADFEAEFDREPLDQNAMGQLDRRPITHIAITHQPKTEYTYPETLNLSDLRVTVTYGVLGDGVESYEPTENLSYAQLLGRLSVNYWPNNILPTDPDGAPDYGGAVGARKAANGDHLTIAPTHDRLDIDGTYYPADEANGGFSYDGKYLILTSRAHESMAYEAQPVFVTEPITVHPLDLTYTLTAMDKVYNESGYAGKTSTGGTITLQNPYTATKRAEVPDGQGGTETVTVNDRDLIYVTTDVDYENLEGYTGLADYINSQDSREEAYTFTATGLAGSRGLAFDFFDENVVYYDDVHTSTAPVAPQDWVGYWNSFSHAPKTPGSQGWDSYGEVGVMPVLVSNIVLGGPDKANYVLDGAVGSRADLSQNADDPNKDAAPYAKMEKATQAVIPGERPVVSVDAHSNAVKLTYETDITAQQNGGDLFKDELHYEYALEYQLSDDALTQWGGEEGWTDHPYFGGERKEDQIPEDYVPTENDPGSTGESEIVKGQNYPWAAEDPSLGERTPLDRGTVYWGVVRLSETHNYKVSEPVHAIPDPTDAGEISRTAESAEQTARDISALVESWAEEEPEEDVNLDPPNGPAPAVKTYKQGFILYSTEKKTGADNEEYALNTLEAVWFTDLQIFEKKEVLDAAIRNLPTARYYGYYWDQSHSAGVEFDSELGLDLRTPFTVTVQEETEDGRAEKEQLVNENGLAQLYVVTKRSGGGGSLNDIVVSGGGGGIVGGATEGTEAPTYVVGGEPITLKVQFRPSSASYEGIDWTTSDPRVVLVDSKGTVYFVGVGTAVITATTRKSKKTATVTLTVTDPNGFAQGVGTGWETALALAGREENRFNFYYTEPIFTLDDRWQFHPGWTMTRGELASILAQFYLPEEEEPWNGETAFPDLTGEESYAEAAELLRQGGILTGLPGGTFGGEQEATRSEIAAILCRMMGLPPVEEDRNAFLDYGGISTNWADGYVEALARAGVVLGAGEDYFHPERCLTREEAAAMLGRILLSGVYYGKDGAAAIPSDVTESHWGYSLILRSVNTVVPREM